MIEDEPSEAEIHLSPEVAAIKARTDVTSPANSDVVVLLREVERLQDIVQTYDQRFATLHDEKQALIRSLQAKLDEALRS